MCGRYSLTRRQSEVIERFGIEELLAKALEPRYNIAPTQPVAVVLEEDGKRVLDTFRWGLIPYWTKDPKKTKLMINARSETLGAKPFFKQSLEKRRCIIPADGFYEWKTEGKNKTPMHIYFPDHELFGFAGLWDEWRNPDGETIRSCTIITTDANDFMSNVHDRMPVIIKPEYEQLWLDPAMKDLAQLNTVLKPLPENALKMHQVSSRVNKASAQGADLIEPDCDPVQLRIL